LTSPSPTPPPHASLLRPHPSTRVHLHAAIPPGIMRLLLLHVDLAYTHVFVLEQEHMIHTRTHTPLPHVFSALSANTLTHTHTRARARTYAKERERETETETERERARERETERARARERHTKKETETETESARARERDRETERQSMKREREREREGGGGRERERQGLPACLSRPQHITPLYINMNTVGLALIH
jgi:flagellar biosynthesis GTPase FlhF